MAHLSVFLFDYDGTLVDSLAVFKLCLNQALGGQGLPALDVEEDFLRLFEGNMNEGLRALGLAPEQGAPLLADLGSRLARCQDQAPFFPGIPEMLRDLVGRAEVAVVTSNVGEVVRGKLAQAGLLDLVTEILGSDAEPSKVRKIQRFRNRVPAGTPVHYVGDTLGDMREGRAAGAITVGVAWGWHRPDRLRQAHPDHIANTPADILALAKPAN
jgi:phosphoglycolate phosphatase